MKKFFFGIGLVLVTATAMAQTSNDANADVNGHRGLDYSIDVGYDIATKGGNGNIAAEAEIGKRFSKNFYWGFVGSGAYIPTGDGDPWIPIYTHFKAFLPLHSSKISPFIGLKAGYVVNTASDETVGSGRYETKVEQPDFVMVNIMPGIEFPLSKMVDFRFSAGYTHFIPTKGSGSSGAVAIRAGFAFHKNAIRREPVPTRDKGMQLTLEGGKIGFGGSYDGGFGNIVLTYKMNPNISFGLGGGVEPINVSKTNGWTSTVDVSAWHGNGYTPDPRHNTGDRDSHSSSINDIDNDATAIKAFVRGQYRLNDNKLSPFASVDVGMRFYDWGGDNSAGFVFGSLIDDFNEDRPSTGIFVAPSLGLSYRTFNNSYLELRAGYSISSGLKKWTYDAQNTLTDEISTESSIRPIKIYQDYAYHYERKKTSLSAPFIMLSWTHTFGSRKR